MSNPIPHKTLCQFTPKDEPCGVEIVQDRTSYSGWSHAYESFPGAWQHWASPIRYGLGREETKRIFKPARCNGGEVVKR